MHKGHSIIETLFAHQAMKNDNDPVEEFIKSIISLKLNFSNGGYDSLLQ